MTKFLLILLCYMISEVLSGQEVPKNVLEKLENAPEKKITSYTNNLPDSSLIRRGRITLKDGFTLEFRKLEYKNDSVLFRDTLRTYRKYPLNEISEIIKLKRQPWKGAGTGALVGGVAGLIAGYLIYPEDNFLDTLIKLFSNNEEGEGPELSKKAIPVIFGGILAGGALGTLFGLDSFKESLVYEGKPSIGVYPGMQHIPGQGNAMLCTVKIRWK